MATDPQPVPGAPPENELAPEQAAPPSSPSAPPPSAAPPQHVIKRTRTGGVWVAVGVFAIVLLLLLIFVLMNGTEVRVAYIGAPCLSHAASSSG